MTTYRDKADTERCYFCPKRTDIEVHHIVPQRFNGGDQRENLVAVCDRCHEKLEQLYDSRFYEVLGVSDEAGERKAHFSCTMSDCRNQARVECGPITAPEPMWVCLGCATELFCHWENGRIFTDLSGKMAARKGWIDAVQSRDVRRLSP